MRRTERCAVNNIRRIVPGDRRRSFSDRDRRVATCRVVVAVAAASVECPVRSAARHVGKRRSEIQQAAQVLAVNARGSAGGAVRVSIICARVAGDIDGSVSLPDRECLRIAAAGMIRVPGKRVARRSRVRAGVHIICVHRSRRKAEVRARNRHRARCDRGTCIDGRARAGHRCR